MAKKSSEEVRSMNNTFEEIIEAIPQKPYFRDSTADVAIYCARFI